MTDYQKIKYSVSGFIAGIGVLFGLATVLLMPPEEMWRWILNSQSNGAKVEKALSNTSEQLANLEKRNQELKNDLVNEKALNIEKYQALVDDNLQLKKSASDLQDKLENIENITAQLDKNNGVLADKNKELQSIVAAPNEKTFHSPSELYIQSSGTLKVGSEFVDPATSTTLGISKILYGDEAIGYISLPGKKPEYFNNITAGYVWTFEELGKQYVLTLKKANYLDQNFSVDIREEVN